MSTIRRINGKRTREYSAWKAMKSRCYSPSMKNYRGYQDKGIIVCDEWLHNFNNFLEDMGICPDNMTLDRIDNDKGYSKDNCRWATRSEQTKNRGNFNKLFTYNNKTQVLKDWARELNIKYTTLYLRIYRSELSCEDAISIDPFNVMLTYKGMLKSLTDWSKITGVPKSTIIDRKRRGWDVNRIFEQKINFKK
jgi:hypothetical protein